MLLLGIVCLVAAMGFGIAATDASSNGDAYQAGMVITGVLGIAFLLVYLLTRYSIVKIASAADAIEFKVSRVGKAKVLDFVNALELVVLQIEIATGNLSCDDFGGR